MPDIGRRRTASCIDTSGELDGIEFTDAAGLGRALHDNPATGPCFVRRLYSYATGRAVVRRDMAWVTVPREGIRRTMAIAPRI